MRLPPPLYREMAQRLAAVRRQPREAHESWRGHYDRQHAVLAYLARSSCDAFLHAYVRADPQIHDELVGFDSPAGSDIRTIVLALLHRGRLLPEKARQDAIARMTLLAVSSPDASWIEDNDWHLILTTEDREQLFRRVRHELVPRLEPEVERWFEDATKNDDDPVDEALERYGRAFEQRQDPDVASEFDRARDQYNNARFNLPDDEDDGWRPDTWNGLSKLRIPQQPPEPTRSLFDDVDR